MHHEMNAFQMGGILNFHLIGKTIMHPLENIHPISPKGNQFCNNVYIRKTTMFFQSTHNNLPPLSITCYKEMGIGM
jgi:hypothetical protein